MDSSGVRRSWLMFKKLTSGFNRKNVQEGSPNFYSKVLNILFSKRNKLEITINNLDKDVKDIKERIKSLESRKLSIQERIKELNLEKKNNPKAKKLINKEIKALRRELSQILKELSTQRVLLNDKLSYRERLIEKLNVIEEKMEEIGETKLDIDRSGSYGNMEFNPGNLVKGREHSLFGESRDETSVQIHAEGKINAKYAYDKDKADRRQEELEKSNSAWGRTIYKAKYDGGRIQLEGKWSYVDYLIQKNNLKTRSAATRTSRYDGERGYHFKSR